MTDEREIKQAGDSKSPPAQERQSEGAPGPRQPEQWPSLWDRIEPIMYPGLDDEKERPQHS